MCGIRCPGCADCPGCHGCDGCDGCRECCSRLPTYAKVLISMAVIGCVIVGLYFVVRSRFNRGLPHASTASTFAPQFHEMDSSTKYTPYSVAQLLEQQKATNRIMTNIEFDQNLQEFAYHFFDLLRQMEAGKNIIISPFSIETSLAMVRMGSEGETANEIGEALGINGFNIDSLADNYLTFLSNYKKSNFLHMANKIYVNKNYEFQDNFKHVISQKFLASSDTIDFIQVNQAANEINVWIENRTNHKISKIVAPEMFNADTMAVLLSAIHFEDEWRTQFDASSTKEMDFYVAANISVRVPMMHKLNVFGYNSLPELDANMVQLPYKNSNLSMVILLPNSRTGLQNMLEGMLENFPTLIEKIRSSISTNVDLYLPKFRAEFEVELTKTLKQMGMVKAFENGEFQKMLKTPKPIGISQVVHKAFIDVDEKGTKAAAATGAVAQSRSLAQGYPMICDHPFYYMIVNPDFIPLFQGVVVNF